MVKRVPIFEATVRFRAPGNTPKKQPSICAPSYTARGFSRKAAIRAANAMVPRGCQGHGIGSYGHPDVRIVR